MESNKKIYTEENGDYLKNNPSWHIEDSPWKAKQILNMLSRNKLEPVSIVEIGCGAGEILDQLYLSLPENVNFTGYDISVDALKLAEKKRKNRLRFKNHGLEETNEKVDVLLMIDVFEHVEDYMGFLRSHKSKAKNIIFHIPLDISVNGIMRNKLINSRKTVGHLHYFTKETALATLADTGYEVVDFFYTQGSIELPRKTFRSKLMILPRKICFKINQDLAAKLFGGFSLMVLAK